MVLNLTDKNNNQRARLQTTASVSLGTDSASMCWKGGTPLFQKINYKSRLKFVFNMSQNE